MKNSLFKQKQLDFFNSCNESVEKIKMLKAGAGGVAGSIVMTLLGLVAARFMWSLQHIYIFLYLLI